MENYEGFSDLLSNAIHYGLSNKRAIIIWGILYLVAMLVYIVGIVIGIVAYKNTASQAVLLLSAVPMLVVGVMIMGYNRRCLSGLFTGNSVASDVTDPIGMAIDGIKIFIISLEAMVIMLIIYTPLFLLLLASSRYSGAVCAYCLLYPVVLVLMVLVYVVNMLQWAVFADTGSLLSGLNPIRAARLIIGDFRYAVVAALTVFVLYIMAVVAMLALLIPVVTIVLIPIVIIVFYLAIVYILARFYQHATGMSDRTPTTSTT